jgi:membrane fusion protein
MNSPLFRQEVIDAGRDRLAGTVVAAVPPNSRLYATVVMLFAAALVAILLLGEYATRTQVKGVVAYDAGIARVYPNALRKSARFTCEPECRLPPALPWSQSRWHRAGTLSAAS